jgi:hypothetical protein
MVVAVVVVGGGGGGGGSKVAGDWRRHTHPLVVISYAVFMCVRGFFQPDHRSKPRSGEAAKFTLQLSPTRSYIASPDAYTTPPRDTDILASSGTPVCSSRDITGEEGSSSPRV